MKAHEMRGVVLACMSVDHPDKQATVGVLFRSEAGEWEPRADNMGEATTMLRDDSPLDSNKAGLFRSYPGLRDSDTRRHFETAACPLCGFKMSCRAEKLDPVLDDLWERGRAAGLGERLVRLPLRLVAARV